eukprot:SAG31_NODE_853_length_11512_cov_42.663279_7_plen_71_part_00
MSVDAVMFLVAVFATWKLRTFLRFGVLTLLLDLGLLLAVYWVVRVTSPAVGLRSTKFQAYDNLMEAWLIN